MSAPKKYMAASVPRFLRQTRLGYLPLKCIIGSHLTYGDGGANLYFDIVMLPAQEFQRMRSYVGLQHVIAPALQAGPSFTPSFILADAREIIVPAGEADPEAFARRYFLAKFNLAGGSSSAMASGLPLSQKSDFANAADQVTLIDR